MKDILESAMYAGIFLVVTLVVLAVGYYVLDALTPGTTLGNAIAGEETVVARQGVTETVNTASHSAALVASAWMIMQGLIIFTAIWTNSGGTDFGEALGWTVAFSVVGLVLQSIAFVVLDLITPGKLGEVICRPGSTNALAKLTAANIVAVGLVVIAVIS